ncbi:MULTISPECIES: diacylglycerol kinase family protein [unclassified Streptomyces]|uniref:diacylglycerol/lipid kinase family protein n=1 Tax=unclassified Streptomyces TaxID=2593676 RepID=UPI002E7A5365|nr:diacylglycerol kinase family protein [Streptomyces sp. JV176]MEE1798024.1 diacylglycerol kinase family protein [Streptomyces sp. JV176]
MAVEFGEGAHAAQRWSARVSLAASGAAVLLPLGYAGAAASLLLIGAILAGTALTAAAVWWVLTRRGAARVGAAVLSVATPFTVIAVFAAANLLWLVLVCAALWAVAVWTGRTALSSTGATRTTAMREHETPPPLRPFLIMNPRSGGGKVGRFGLREKAERLGAQVVLLDPDHPQDVAALARRAADDGADLLGVAGGDGTQALVAAVAAERGLPFLVISSGTRNHFAMDLGLDRENPSACLDALTDGVELHVDLGFAGGHPFVNNASFGAYAAVVQSPAYRDDKVRTTLDLLPELLTHERGPLLTVTAASADGGTGGAPVTVTGPQALLVSNNPYRTEDPAGLGRRERLDAGVLGVLGVRVDSAAEAAGLLRGRQSAGLTVLTAHQVTVDADRAEIEVGVDGEALVLPAPVRCRIEPGALRVRVPRNRPGVPPVQPPLDRRRLRKLAAAVGRTAVARRERPAA